MVYYKCQIDTTSDKYKSKERLQMREVKTMNTRQFHGIIKMIIQMIRDDTPKEQLLKWLEKLIE